MSREYIIQVKYEVMIERTVKADDMDEALKFAKEYALSDPVDTGVIAVRKNWTYTYSSGEVVGVLA
ncbi:hypothetical protein V3390_09395 [Luteimonas sp. FXH3W]|uniref:DpnD/PcfM-like protein n=1 Tax=Aquilutibacter rugosus TaxID=3115820 RepID=A0ABU7V0Y9_9GAMM